MAESRIKGNNRLDPPDKGRSYFDDPFGMNRDNLPIVSSSGNDYALTLNEDGISSLIPVGVNPAPTPINVEPNTAIQFASGSAGNEVLSGSLDFVYDYTNKRVGLGISNPSVKLHISGASNADLLKVSSPINPNILFISGSGRVGIGTTSPSSTLSISGNLSATGTANVSTILAASGEINSLTAKDYLIVGDGTDSTTAFAVIKNLYLSKEAAASGKNILLDSKATSEDNKKAFFIVEDNTTNTSSSIMTLTSDERVGIGTENPQAKLQVVGSVLISGSSTLTNIGPAVFSGSITQQPIFTASLGYLISTNALINGNVTITGTASVNTLVVNQTQYTSGSNQLGDAIDDTQILYGSVIIPTGSLTITGSSTITDSLYVIKKVSIGTTHQSASLTISASSADNAMLIKLNDGNGDTDKFKINDEGIIVLGALNSLPTAVAGGIYFSSENDYFFGFS